MSLNSFPEFVEKTPWYSNLLSTPLYFNKPFLMLSSTTPNSLAIATAKRLLITLCLPGIGKIISGVPRQPRGRVRTPRPKETDDDYYHPMQPQGSTRYPPMPAKQRQTGNPFAPQPQTPTQPYMPTTQAPNPYQKPYYETPKQRVKRLMDKLMAGESLTTEELMELQRFD